ncbi:hypothetical protein [Acidianus brierleyi]|nr:hypothetical protein [Acidianus brierleyi]AWR95476.2 hypothetical protein DFR85_13610 [Acidianus brierleyi]
MKILFFRLASFLMFLSSLAFAIIIIYAYISAKKQAQQMKEKYLYLSIANFLDKASNFYSGKTSELIEEVILYYSLNKNNLDTKTMAEKIYERLQGVIAEVQDLLNAGKDVFRLENLSKDIDKFKFVFIIVSFPSILLSLIYLITSFTIPYSSILPYLFSVDIFSFFLSIGSLSYIGISLSKIQNEIDNYKKKFNIKDNS